MERKHEGNTNEFQKLVDGKAKYMVADLGGNGNKNCFFKPKPFIIFKDIGDYFYKQAFADN